MTMIYFAWLEGEGEIWWVAMCTDECFQKLVFLEPHILHENLVKYGNRYKLG